MLPLITLTESMLRAAESGDWEDFARLLSEREQAWPAVFANFAVEDCSAEDARQVEVLRGLNQRVEALAKAHQQEIKQELRGLKLGDRAKRAYKPTRP